MRKIIFTFYDNDHLSVETLDDSHDSEYPEITHGADTGDCYQIFYRYMVKLKDHDGNFVFPVPHDIVKMQELKKQISEIQDQGKWACINFLKLQVTGDPKTIKMVADFLWQFSLYDQSYPYDYRRNK